MSREPDNDAADGSDGPVDRRSLLRYGGAGAVVGLAGCQSPENPLLEPGQGRVPEEVVPPGPDDEEGGEGGPLEGETLRIGILAPMNQALGRSQWHGAQMAAKDYNENGGLLGARVEVELGDTELSPGVAESEHRRLVVQEGCDMTMGSFLGSGLLQTLPSIANQEKIHVTTGSAEPRVGQLVSKSVSVTGDDPEEEYERFKYHFRAGPLHLLDLADAMLEFIEDKMDDFGWERAAVLTENLGEFTPYHEAMAAEVNDLLDVRMTERPGGISDWSPIFNDIEAEGCEVALVGLALAGTTAVNQWAQQERQFEMGGIHVNSQEFEYWESTSGNCEYIWTMNSLTPQTENTPDTQDFVQRYIEMWDTVPIYTGPLTYDAITLMEQVFEDYHEAEGLDGIPEADELVPYIEDLNAEGGHVTELEGPQFTPPDAEYAHEPNWTTIAETGVPIFQQWQYDPDVRDDYGTMHAFYPPQNQTSEYQVPDWIE